MADLSADKAQKSADIAVIDAYLSEHNLFAHTDPTGIRYRILDAGSGAAPSQCNQVTLSYTAVRMSDDQQFEEILPPVSTAMQNLVTGLQIGIPKVNSGGQIIIYVPSVYGYGTQGKPSVPPNENLIYTVDVIDID